MKKAAALILVLMMVFSLTGCKSKEAKLADKLITDIGEVTLDSENAIKYAEASYASLSEDDKKDVEGLEALTAARAAYDELVAIKNADELIAKVGEVDYTQVQAVKDAFAAYDALPEEAKGKVADAAKIESAKAKLDELLCLVGSWVYEFDISEEMNAELKTQFDGFSEDLTFDGTLSVPMLFEFDENGAVTQCLDKELFAEHVSEYLAPYVDALTAYTFEILSQQYGLSEEEGDAAYQEAYSMTVREYSEYAISDALALSVAAVDFSYTGTYNIDGDKLYTQFPDEDDEEGYNVFKVEGDTLTFVSTTYEQGNYVYPMVLTKK